jgi:hypothetical protein
LVTHLADFFELKILVKSGLNHFSPHVIDCEFHDTLLLVILHFGGDLGDGSLRVEVSLILLLIITYICILVEALS